MSDWRSLLGLDKHVFCDNLDELQGTLDGKPQLLKPEPELTADKADPVVPSSSTNEIVQKNPEKDTKAPEIDQTKSVTSMRAEWLTDQTEKILPVVIFVFMKELEAQRDA